MPPSLVQQPAAASADGAATAPNPTASAAFALLAVLFNVIWGYVRRDRRLLSTTIDAAGVAAISRRFRLGLVWLATAILLGALVPVLGVAVIAAFILYF